MKIIPPAKSPAIARIKIGRENQPDIIAIWYTEKRKALIICAERDSIIFLRLRKIKPLKKNSSKREFTKICRVLQI